MRSGPALAGWMLYLLLPSPAAAQQTIFNVPSGDVLKKGEVYVELDVPLRPQESRFVSFVPRLVVGVGRRVEVGLNFTGNIQPGTDTTTLAPTFKWKLYDGKENGWSFVVGDTLQIPVRNRAYDVGNYAYVQCFKTFRRGTRIGFGAYDFTARVVAPGGNRAGGQFTFEHPVHPKLTLAADWYTGNHASGYASLGAIAKPHPRVTLYTAYSVGNSGVRNGNHFFLIELGYTLK
ncbi:MAG: hypothetical protein ACRD2Y_02760 [Terriglobales bacterium]